MEQEVWKEVDGYNKKYFISSFGNVKRYDDSEVNLTITKNAKIIDNRIRLRLTSANGSKVIILKRLVIDNFYPELKTKKVQISHIDANEQNCRLDNLYVVYQQNVLFNGTTDMKIKEVDVSATKELIVEITNKYRLYDSIDK
jgi:hypothetical protein